MNNYQELIVFLEKRDDSLCTEAAKAIERLSAEERACRAEWNRANAGWDQAKEKLAALRAQLAQQEPVAWMWQHDETGRVGFVDCYQVENGWQEHNPRNLLVCKLYRHPTTQADAKNTEHYKNLLIKILEDYPDNYEAIRNATLELNK